MFNQKGIAFVPLLGIVVVGVVIIGAVWYTVVSTKSPTTNVNPATNTATSTNVTVDVTARWKTYTNAKNGISFKYSDAFAVRTDDSTGNTVSVNFEGSGKYVSDTIHVGTLPNISGKNLNDTFAKLKSWLPGDYFNTATVTDITNGKIVYRVQADLMGQYPYAYIVGSTRVWTLAYQNDSGKVALADMESIIKGMTRTFIFFDDAVAQSQPPRMATCDEMVSFEKAKSPNLSAAELKLIRYDCIRATAAIEQNSSSCALIPIETKEFEEVQLSCYGGVAYGYGEGDLAVCNKLSGETKFLNVSRKEVCLRAVASQCCKFFQLKIQNTKTEPKVCTQLRSELDVSGSQGFCKYF